MGNLFLSYGPILLGFIATIIALNPNVRNKSNRFTCWGYSAIIIAIFALGLKGWDIFNENKQNTNRKGQAIETLLNEMAPQLALYKYHMEIGIAPPKEVNKIISSMTKELEKKFQLHYEYLSNSARVHGQTVVSNQTIVSLISNDPNRTEADMIGRIGISFRLQEKLADILCNDAKEIGSENLCLEHKNEVEKLYKGIEESIKKALPNSIPKINKID